MKVAKLQPFLQLCVWHEPTRQGGKKKNGLIIFLSGSSSRSSCSLCLSETSFRNSKPKTFIWTWCYSWAGFSAVCADGTVQIRQYLTSTGWAWRWICLGREWEFSAYTQVIHIDEQTYKNGDIINFFSREVHFYCSYFLTAGGCSPHNVVNIVYIPSNWKIM